LSTETLRSEIDTELRRPSPWAFPPLLEAQYRARNNMTRRGRLMAAMAIAGAVVVAGLGPDWLAGAAVFKPAMMPRIGVALAFLLAALALHRVRQVWLETLLVWVPTLAALGVIQFADDLAMAHDATYVQYFDRVTLGAAIGVMALLLLPTWRFSAVLVTAGSAALALPLLSVLMPHAPPPARQLTPMALAEGLLLLTMVVAMRMETARRTLFLHALRGELSGVALDQANAEVLRLSTTDTLTGFANRRHFDAEIARLWRDRGRTDIGLALIEIDGFSDYIERAGSAEADNTLREISRVVGTGLRQDWDRPGRWQDAAFAALLPSVGREELYLVGERLRQAVAQLAIPYPGQPGRFVSISVGLAWCAGASGHMTAAQALQDADAALFAAKSLGSNKVVLAGDTSVRTSAPAVEAAPYQRGSW
jgi:diguanylate cyclase (GGDEF)-like protein